VIRIRYLYKAANKAGQTIEGIIDASDENAVISALRGKSLYLIELSDANPKSSALDINIGSAKIPKKALAVFCTQFASILKAGVPLIQAIEILEEQTENKKLKQIMQTVNDDLQRGLSLSESFSVHEKALPAIMLKMIEAGEVSGTLDLSLERLALNFEKENAITKKIRGAMMYPIIVIIVALAVVVFLLLSIIPTFTNIFKTLNKPMPGVTQFLLTLSNGIIDGWWIILICVAVVYFLFRTYKRSPAGSLQLDKFKLKIPVFGKASLKIITARLCRTLSTLNGSGISLTQSLRAVSKVVGNKIAENKLLEAEDHIKQGKSLHHAIESAGIFPGMLTHMTKIGEESGTLDEMLERASVYFEDEADSAITKATTLIQPILLVFVAAIVVFILLSVMLPMFNLYQNLSQS
jgi:type IV pilus assembly protein PilC